MANPELKPPPRKNARSKKPVAAVTPAELALMKKHQLDVQDVLPSPRKISPFADGSAGVVVAGDERIFAHRLVSLHVTSGQLRAAA